MLHRAFSLRRHCGERREVASLFATLECIEDLINRLVVASNDSIGDGFGKNVQGDL
jgi:hypothetical protein